MIHEPTPGSRLISPPAELSWVTIHAIQSLPLVPRCPPQSVFAFPGASLELKAEPTDTKLPMMCDSLAPSRLSSCSRLFSLSLPVGPRPPPGRRPGANTAVNKATGTYEKM
ncbi:unnamed protein product [Pleuronectes platessa]|uniref:Uncharacterized protein n=1 Tax=Pleuronectes platessa TaxID=8262 RepID=A0A9N7VNV6_PLEPL|nr:unnamed protein product [Pleuronectes platessa]